MTTFKPLIVNAGNVYQLDDPDGLTAAHVTDIDYLDFDLTANAAHETGRLHWHEEDGRIFLREHKMRQNWSWADNRWLMLENGKMKEFKFGHRIYSAVEIAGLLKGCGFDSINIYGDLDGADYDQNAKRLVAVARK